MTNYPLNWRGQGPKGHDPILNFAPNYKETMHFKCRVLIDREVY